MASGIGKVLCWLGFHRKMTRLNTFKIWSWCEREECLWSDELILPRVFERVKDDADQSCASVEQIMKAKAALDDKEVPDSWAQHIKRR